VISSSYQRYLARRGISAQTQRRVAIQCVTEQPSNECLIERSDGAVWLALLEWDSQVLGVQTGRINAFFSSDEGWNAAAVAALLGEAQGWLRDRHVRFASCRVSSSDLVLCDTLLKEGWESRDTLNVYTRAPEARTPETTGEARTVDLSSSQITPFLDEFADAFRLARMHLDPRIGRERANRFYRALCTRISEDPSGKAVGVFDEGRLAGIAIGGLDEPLHAASGLKLAYVWQIAVFREFRGRGVGSMLLKGLEDCFAQADLIEAGTQADNVSAQSMYRSRGFAHSATAVTFHKWMA
jgi:ribosomal protein S18 acetylase RimI-like enzyme